MAIRILLDENIAPAIRTAVLQLDATIDILRVGDADAPPTGTKDPDILRYLETSQRVMVTDNRRSIPEHIADHHAAGGSHWWIFWFRPSLSIGELAEAIYILWAASFDDEWRDQTGWLPL